MMRSLQAKCLNQVDLMKIKITGMYTRLQISKLASTSMYLPYHIRKFTTLTDNVCG